MPILKKETYLIIFFFITLLLVSYILKNSLDLNFLFQKYLNYRVFIDKHLFFFSIFFIFSFIFWVSTFLPFITFFQILAGFIFGAYLGTFISIFSVLIGSLLIYLYPLNKIKIKINSFNKIDFNYLKEKINQNEFFYLLLIRVMPGFPFFLQGAVCSYLKVNIYKYMITTFIGFLPICFMINFFGSELDQSILNNEIFEINFQKNKFYYVPILVVMVIYFLKFLIHRFFKKIYL